MDSITAIPEVQNPRIQWKIELIKYFYGESVTVCNGASTIDRKYEVFGTFWNVWSSCFVLSHRIKIVLKPLISQFLVCPSIWRDGYAVRKMLDQNSYNGRQYNLKPCITKVIAAPLQVPSLTLEYHWRVENRSICVNSFNDHLKLPISIFNRINHILISVNHGSYPCINAKLNTLFVHMVEVLRQNTIFFNHISKHIKEFIDYNLIQCLRMCFLQPYCLLRLWTSTPYRRSIGLWRSIWNFTSTLWNRVVHFLNPVPGFQK